MVKAQRCSKCTRPVLKYATMTKTRIQIEQESEREDDRIREIVSELKERMKRKVMRQLQNGEIDYDARIDKLIYTETKEELNIEEESDVDSEDM